MTRWSDGLGGPPRLGASRARPRAEAQQPPAERDRADREPRPAEREAGLAVGLAVAVAASRVMLAEHWLSDVVAGLALGWAWFSVCAIAFGGRLLSFGAGARAARTEARRAAQPV